MITPREKKSTADTNGSLLKESKNNGNHVSPTWPPLTPCCINLPQSANPRCITITFPVADIQESSDVVDNFSSEPADDENAPLQPVSLTVFGGKIEKLSSRVRDLGPVYKVAISHISQLQNELDKERSKSKTLEAAFNAVRAAAAMSSDIAPRQKGSSKGESIWPKMYSGQEALWKMFPQGILLGSTRRWCCSWCHDLSYKRPWLGICIRGQAGSRNMLLSIIDPIVSFKA